MNYAEAIDYVLGFADFERTSRSASVFDTSRIEAFLQTLGNPQNCAKSVHIAGTKGKGSTAAMIAAILARAGYRTGLYTSPHLHSFTERIRIDGQPIPEPDFALAMDRLRTQVAAFHKGGTHGELTTFELLTALAFACFRDKAADYQVLETGLGGRLDATNVITPSVCAITSISLDHTEVLGSTLERIAREKAGIIKPGKTCVSAPQPEEVRAVLADVCRSNGARLIEAGKDIRWRQVERLDSGQGFRLDGLHGAYDLRIPLLGEHQVENAAVAVGLAETLADQGATISSEEIAGGLAGVSWPGRLQVLRREPLVVVDGAHNADSARRLVSALRENFNFERMILVLGTSRDKDIAGIVDSLSGICSTAIVTRSANPRSADPGMLARAFALKGIQARQSESVAEAMAMAVKEAMPRDLIGVTGSLFVVAEATQWQAAVGNAG